MYNSLQGEEYFVRVSAYNMKGFGPTELSNPISAVPSSWHDLDNSQPRYEGSTDKMHIVAAQFGLTLQNAPATTQSSELMILYLHISVISVHDL